MQFHSPIQVEVAGLSHPGKVRATNEDHYYITRFGRFIETLGTNLPVGKSMDRSEDASYGMLVADGISGSASGDVASREAITVLLTLLLQSPDEWIRHSDDDKARDQILQRAATRITQINQKLREQAKTDVTLHGFGTTFTVAWNVGSHLFIAHIGNSRAYLFRETTLEQLTHDHTFAQDLVDRGVIGSEEASQNRMRHVLTRALGDKDEQVEPELRQLHLEDGDALLLCSDGLTDTVSEQNIVAVLAGAPTCEGACQQLLDQALDAGGKDNTTIIAARYRKQK